MLEQVQEILRKRFSGVSEEEIDQIGEKLRNPFKQRFRTDSAGGREHAPQGARALPCCCMNPKSDFAILDWIAMAGGSTGGGLGSALYDRVRSESVDLGC